MKEFYNKINQICNKNERVAMFIDMDGTVVEYIVYGEKEKLEKSVGLFSNAEPIDYVIKILEEINNIENIDLYILTLAKSSNIVKEKEEWLQKYMAFIDKSNWIIVNKETGEYTKENRDFIKAYKMKEKLPDYDFLILLDDDHKILKQTKKELGDKCNVYHLSSAII